MLLSMRACLLQIGLESVKDVFDFFCKTHRLKRLLVSRWGLSRNKIGRIDHFSVENTGLGHLDRRVVRWFLIGWSISLHLLLLGK